MKKILLFVCCLFAGTCGIFANTADTGLRYSGQWLNTYDSIVAGASGYFTVTMTKHTSEYKGWSVVGDLTIEEGDSTATSARIRSTGPGKGRIYYYYDDNPSADCKCGIKAVSLNVYKSFSPSAYNIDISGPDCVLEGDTVVYSIDPILTKNLTQGIGVDEYFWTFTPGLVQEQIYRAGDNSSVTFIAGAVTGYDTIKVQVGLANAGVQARKALGKAAPKPIINSRCIAHGESNVLFTVSNPQPGINYNWSCNDDSWSIDVNPLHTDSAYISPENDAAASITVVAYYDGYEQCSASKSTLKVSRTWSDDAQILATTSAPYVMNKEYEFTLEGGAGGGLNWTPPTGWTLKSSSGYKAKFKPINSSTIQLSDVLRVESKNNCSLNPQTAEIPIFMKPAKVTSMNNTICITPNALNTFSISNWEDGPHADSYRWKLYKGNNLAKDTTTATGVTNLSVTANPEWSKLVVIPIGAYNGTLYYTGDPTEFDLTFRPETPLSIQSSKECVAYNMPDEITLSIVDNGNNPTQLYAWNIPSELSPEYQDSLHRSVIITTDGQPESYHIQAWGTGTGECGNSGIIDKYINVVENLAVIQYLDYTIPFPVNYHVKGYSINGYGSLSISTYDWYFFDNGTIVDGLDSNTGQLVNFKDPYTTLQDIENSTQYGLVCVVTFTNSCKVLITYGAVPDLTQTSLVHAPTSSSAPQKHNSSKLLLYPNPTNNEIIVDLDVKKEEIIDAYIVDMNGKIIMSQKGFNLGHRLNINSLPNGQYIMCVKQGNKSFAKPFVKQ